MHPEELEPGNVQRTTASASWLTRDADDFSAVTIGYGINATGHGDRQAVFGEGTRRIGRTSLFGRIEVLQVETNVLLNDGIADDHDAADRADVLGAVTLGGIRDLPSWHGLEAGIGASVTLYGVPHALEGTHGARPVSFQIFLRVRPPASGIGRMWNMRMSQPMSHP